LIPLQGGFDKGLLRFELGPILQGHRDELVHGWTGRHQGHLKMGGSSGCKKAVASMRQDATQVGGSDLPALARQFEHLQAAIAFVLVRTPQPGRRIA